MRRTLFAVLLLPLLVSLAAQGPVGAQTEEEEEEGQQEPGPAFPTGNWQGTAVFGGAILATDVFGETGGGITFELQVSDDEVIAGSLGMTGFSSSDVPEGSGEFAIEGEFDLSGTPDLVQFDGTVSFNGTVTAQGLTVPVNTSAPGGGQFSPTTVTCSRATGDIATHGRELQQAAGVLTSVEGPFVAIRVASADQDQLVGEYGQTAQDIEDALAIAETANGHLPPTVEELLDLVRDVIRLFNRIVDLEQCGAVPPGFEQGLADPYFSALFRKLALELLEHEDELTVPQLLLLLSLSYDIGAIGASSPDPTAAQEALDEFVNVLDDRLDTAIDAQDTDTIQQIYAAAQQFGLEELELKAKAALAEFVEEVGGGGPAEV